MTCKNTIQDLSRTKLVLSKIWFKKSKIYNDLSKAYTITPKAFPESLDISKSRSELVKINKIISKASDDYNKILDNMTQYCSITKTNNEK